MISMVCPDIVVTISPGRCALPSGMFSTMPIAPTALTFALRAASACMRPTTQAAPAMSPFMSSMPAAGLIEMPPVSKQTPLPMKATGAAPRLPPFQRMITVRLSCWEPCPTPSSAFMPSFFISLTSSTSTSDAQTLQTAGSPGEFFRVEHVGRLVDQIARDHDPVRDGAARRECLFGRRSACRRDRDLDLAGLSSASLRLVL